MTNRVKKDIIKLIIDEVVIGGEKLKTAATIPPVRNREMLRAPLEIAPALRRALKGLGRAISNGVHEMEIAKADTPDTFSARGGSAFGGNSGVTLGPITTLKSKVFVGMSAPHQSSALVRGKAVLARAKGTRVFVAMSGGVDSSVAALLLKKQGYDVTGVFMHCWSGNGPDASVGVNCTAERDAEDARRVAEHIGIPFYLFDFEEEYKRRVVAYMVEGYRAGLTPNPDVMCNREIKFGLFFKKALALGADYVATGHYVRLRRELSMINGRFSKRSRDGKFENSKIGNSQKIENWKLRIAKDINKDQSYFLWTLTQNELSRTLFPVGDLLKTEVRVIAKRAGLPTAEKKDSQGICFLGDVSLMDFLAQYLPHARGPVFDIHGERIGEHEGAHFYTMGQRHIGVASHAKGGGTKPHYVVEKDAAKNTVVVAEGSDHPALYRKELTLTDVNFLTPSLPRLIRTNMRMEVMARVRYRQPLAKAVLTKLKAKSWKLIFDSPVKFVAPGQSAVFYTKESEMLGGGVIV